jgi:ArsR family transcriptional regulator, arsenate/arsenite/antimonite-responsive transcriptional repressor
MQMCYNGRVAEKENKPSLDLLFRALADPTRLRLLNLIADREICVCYFVEILRISQPKVSRHLAYLRRAGIVASRREGKWMHYRLVAPKDQASASILREALKHLKDKMEMRRDVSRLRAACCSAKNYELPETAPRPRFSRAPSARRVPSACGSKDDRSAQARHAR